MNVSDRAAPAGMRPLVAQFAKFLVVGGISFSLDYGLFVFLYNVFGVYYILSSTISFATSVVLNYVLSRKYVFEIQEDRSVAREFAFYAVLNVIALFLNQVILYASVDYLSFSPPVGKIIATAVVLVYNFVSRKLLLERPPSTGRDAAQPPDGRRSENGQRSETGVNPMSTERPLRFGKRLLVRAKEAWDAAVAKACESRLAAWWTGTSRPGRVDWALLAALLAVSFVTFLYGDVRATFEHSFNFMDALFSGRVADFYTIAIEHTSSGHPAVYDIPLYFLFGVWNLPTYLFYKFAGYDYLNATPAQLWLKTMMLVFVLLAARILMRIARTMGMDADRAKWVAFYFLSAMSVVLPVFVIVQYDIVLVAVMLLGLHAYMKGNQRGFLLWFMLANTLKLFAVFVFIPLVLLKEKRLRRVAGQAVVGLAGLAFCRLLYSGSVTYKASTGGFTDSMLERLTATGFQWETPGRTVGLFVVCMVGLMIFCYAKRVETDKEIQAYSVYVCLAAFLAFCALVPLNPYWIVLLSPFAVLIVFANPRYAVLNSLLELSIGSSLLVLDVVLGYPIYNRGIFTNLLVGQFFDGSSNPRFATLGEMFMKTGVKDNANFIIAFMLACALAVLVLNYPKRDFVEGMPNRERIPRSIAWVRLGAPVCFVAALFAMYLMPATRVVYSALTDTPAQGSANLLARGATVQERLTFDRKLTVDKLRIGFSASQVTWIDSAVVNVSIKEASTGKVVWHDRVPANAIGEGVHTFDADGTVLEAKKPYTLTIDSSYTENEPAHVQMNPAVDQFPTTENGKKISGDIVMSITGKAE